VDNLLTKGKADPGTGILIGGVKALEKSKYRLREFRVDSNAIVMNAYSPFFSVFSGSDPDQRRLFTPVFQRVPQQVLQQLQ
jgi:hypothetical protein